MSEADRLFSFLAGLRPWAENELRRREVKTLATALATVEKLTEYDLKTKESSSKDSKDGKDQKNKKNGEGNSTNGQRNSEKGRSRQKLRCFICDGEHLARNCPKKQILSSLVEQAAYLVKEPEAEARMGSLQLLNVVCQQMTTNTRVSDPCTLLFIDVELNGRRTKALVDTGASHNFFSVEEAKRLGLAWEKDPSQIKAVNAEEQAAHDVAKRTKLAVGKWVGEIDVTIVDFDDFSVIFVLEFLTACKAFVIPYCRTIGFFGDKDLYMYSGERELVNKGKAKVLSALQLGKGPGGGVLFTNLAAVMQEEPRSATSLLQRAEEICGTEGSFDE